ncbi:ribosomal protein L25, Ctc-form [Aphanomyces invadans]|uniref:Ribosomal protein L25, Ctc-form n=1 Tax=Aphanomyces invadans TaxID=157072 RepID=A0A024TN06_9STRA|nr:ribosomal protein L25, Ctc-form [Aphanomyces invadans]ETV95001.1 ribosomal protein L25, Ctc-form [Aphanomyces invadans]|eukprot:XP_008876174.1 ribosomal protein L25, Ctc-form [Aphanomyces invadans]
MLRQGHQLRATAARALSTAAAAPTTHFTLTPRLKDGSRESRRLRKQGLLPGILYGEGINGDSTRVLVSMNQVDFEREYRKLRTSMGNQVYEVSTGEGGPVTKVLLRDATLHPVTDVPQSVNFLRYKPGRKVHIPLDFLNQESSPGLKRGGYINNVYHEIPCTIASEAIPTKLFVDVNGMHVGQRIYLEDITFPEHVTPLVKAKAVVATIAGKRGLIPKPEEPIVEVVEEVAVDDDDDDEDEPIF